MFNSFSKTALRVLKRKKSFSALHIVGLAIGIATSLLIFMIIRNELSYDRYHKNADRIYRVVGTRTLRSNGEIAAHESNVPNAFPEVFPIDFPEVEAVGTIANPGEGQIYVPQKDGSDEKRFKENDGLAFVNADMFRVFDFTWLAGNATALKDPNTAVLSETTANTYFGSHEKAIGSIIQLWSFRKTFRVVGVYKDMPGNTDVGFKIGFSMPTLRSILGINDRNAWNRNNGTLQCFVLIPKNRSVQNLEAQLPAFVKKYYPSEQASTLSNPTLHFQPLAAMHLNKQYETFNSLSVEELWALGLIGVFLLLVACINFINLATAQAATRAKEIGVRKVLGSDRSQIRKQFLYETGFITLFAVLLGCIMAWVALPWLNRLMQKELAIPITSIAMFISVLFVVVTLLAGFYPAMVLSGFNPVKIFRNRMTSHTKGISLRKGLVVFQFVIAQLLLIGTVVVVKQMQFFRNRSLGFDKDGIALINLPSDSTLRLKRALLKQSLERVPGVISASLCMGGPSNFWEWNTPVNFDNKTQPENFRMAMQLADTGYYKTFGIQLLAGRMPFHSDSLRELVVNETMVKKLGFQSANDVLGKMIGVWDSDRSTYPIVGVVKDFHNRSLAMPISPMAIGSHKPAYEYVAIRVDKNRMSHTLNQIQKVFTQVYPTYLYDRIFMDERIEQYYKSEAITAQLFKVFAILAIFISCLGLYGLVSFMAIQKTKEVGIRKVLGASVESIVYLFSKEFTVLIGIAFLIAAPVGYYFMHQWLSRFHYRIDLGWGVFAVAVVLSVVLAWLTVGYKALKAAFINPVASLKTE